MPIPYPVTLYGCPFKCGHRHVRNEKLMIAHEARCWRNPTNRTCKTCRHESYYTDSAGDIYGDGRYVEPDWYERVCSQPDGAGDSLVESAYEHVQAQHPDNPNLYGVQIPPVVDCPFWEATIADASADTEASGD